MIKLIKNVEVYAPEYKGKNDIIICHDKIIKIDQNIAIDFDEIEIIDGKGMYAVPGYIDQHVHITGGGGEGGPRTRVPEIMLSELVKNGITTTVGLLGTDSITRSIENLLAKVKALREEGLTVYMLTGSYEFPSPTLTGSIKKDIALIDEIIGVKIATSDHRDSNISWQDLAHVASEARVGGMLGNKPGIVTIHMGDGENRLKFIHEVLKNTEIPIKHFVPTHINRNEKLLEDGLTYAKKGGFIDLSACKYSDLAPADIVANRITDDIPLDNITFSTDGNGSTSKYDHEGNIVEISAMSVDTLHYQTKRLIKDFNFNVGDAIRFITSNVSKVLNLYPQKGVLRKGSDADILLLDENYDIDTVIAKGKVMMMDKKVLVTGTYESL